MASLQPGKHAIRIDNRLMRVAVKGHWDDESVHDLRAELESLMPGFAGQPFACIWDMSEFEELTPQSEPLVREMVSWLIAEGLRKDADISPEEDAEKEEQLQQVQPKADIEEYEHRLFRSEADARDWLRGYGFC